VAGVTTAGLAWGQVWPLGVLLVVVLVGKVGFVDPHTTWFRRESPPDQVAGAQHPMRVRLEDNVLFLGYDLIGREAVRAGDLLQVRLYWQATGPLSNNYASFIHLDAPPDNATFATADNFHPGDPQAQNDVPSLHWSPALYVRDEHRLTLPDDIPPIAYSLRVGLYERQTGRRLLTLPEQAEEQGEDTIFLQQIHVLPARPLHPATMQSRQKYRLGESIELVGHSVKVDASTDGQPGQTITVTLYWQSRMPVEKNYTVFVHLLDAGGQVRGQHDGLPVGGTYPTTGWLPGEVVADEHEINVEPGRYQLEVGLYDATTMQRLPVVDGDGQPQGDRVILAEVAVK